jgi:hypothetical protein
MGRLAGCPSAVLVTQDTEPVLVTQDAKPVLVTQDAKPVLVTQVGGAGIREVVTEGGFVRFCGSAETPRNLVFEGKTRGANCYCDNPTRGRHRVPRHRFEHSSDGANRETALLRRPIRPVDAALQVVVLLEYCQERHAGWRVPIASARATG